MIKILIGLIIVFFEFNLDFDIHRVGLMPDFIGYGVILLGLREMSFESCYFAKMTTVTKALMAYSGVMYIVDLIGLSAKLSLYPAIAISIIYSAINLFNLYNIIKGIKDMETKKNKDMSGYTLLLVWKILAVLTPISIVMAFAGTMGYVVLVFFFVANVSFLFVFNTTKNLYFEDKPVESLKMRL